MIDRRERITRKTLKDKFYGQEEIDVTHCDQ